MHPRVVNAFLFINTYQFYFIIFFNLIFSSSTFLILKVIINNHLIIIIYEIKCVDVARHLFRRSVSYDIVGKGA